MKKKPLLFTLVPLILIGVCVSLYFQTAYVLQAPLTDYSRILKKITVFNWVMVSIMIIAGIAILRSSKWAKLFMPMAIAAVIWNNYLVATKTNNFSIPQIVLAILLFAAVFAPLYTKKLRTVLTDRRQQWWKTPFRKRVPVPVAVRMSHGSTHLMQTVDVSTTGLFLRVDNDVKASMPKLGERVTLQLNLGRDRELKCSAVVVRFTEGRDQQPGGMGLQFVELAGSNRKALNQFLKSPDTPA